MSLIRQVANTRAHENIYSPDLFISGTPGHPNTHVHSVVRFCFAENATLIVNSTSKFRANG